MEITEDYIIYRPVDVAVQDFEHFIGIWTADLIERRRLSEFFLKIEEHIATTDEPYSPVLLHQPLERPEDASLPLITPLPPPPGQSPGPKKNKRGGPKQQQPQQQPPRATPSQDPTQSSDQQQHVSVDSLFSKFVAQPISTPPPAVAETELRGPALLQSMFESAAATGDAAVGDIFSTSTSTSSVTTITSATGEKETVSTQNMITSTSLSLPSGPNGKGKAKEEDTVDQGIMLKQLLGIPIIAPSSSTNATDSKATAPSRASSIPPPMFAPINEDEEGTPPRVHTPPRSRNAVTKDVRTTPTPSSKRANGPYRDLVAYDFDDGEDYGHSGPEGIVSPWAPLQPPQKNNGSNNATVLSPSPSMLPKPRAAREKKGGGNRNRRDGSPAQQHQRSPTPKKTHAPRNEPRGELRNGGSIDKEVAVEVLAGTIDGSPDNPVLTRDAFVQELLALINRKDEFVDLVYGKYAQAMRSKQVANGSSSSSVARDPNTIDLQD